MPLLHRYPSMASRDPEELFWTLRARLPDLSGFRATRDGSRPWRARSNAVPLRSASLTAATFSAFAVSGESGPWLRLALPLNRGYRIRFGRIDRIEQPGTVAVYPQDRGEIEVPDGWSALRFDCPRAAIEQAIRDLDGTVPAVTLREGLDHVPAAALDGFKANLQRAVAMLDEAPELLLDAPAFRGGIEDILLLSAAQALIAAAGPAARPAADAPQALGRAIAFIEAHWARDLRLAEIATAAGCSIRTLQAAFRAHAGATVLGFLRDRRLREARARLGAAPPGETVGAVALGCGFTHLGSFAAEYRTAFGETPSATLRQARVH